jgi:hypothetical protein
MKDTFLPPMKIYNDHILTGMEIVRRENSIGMEKKVVSEIELNAEKLYGTIEEDEMPVQFVETIRVENFTSDGYLSTPSFWL